MAAKDLEGLRRAAEDATPEAVEAVARFLRAAGSDEFHQVLAARTVGLPLLVLTFLIAIGPTFEWWIAPDLASTWNTGAVDVRPPGWGR